VKSINPDEETEDGWFELLITSDKERSPSLIDFLKMKIYGLIESMSLGESVLRPHLLMREG
jgi:hypothetical protein